MLLMKNMKQGLSKPAGGSSGPRHPLGPRGAPKLSMEVPQCLEEAKEGSNYNRRFSGVELGFVENEEELQRRGHTQQPTDRAQPRQCATVGSPGPSHSSER